MATWKRDFGSGLIVLVPLLVTVIVIAWVYGHLTRVPVPLGDIVITVGGADLNLTEPARVGLAVLIFVLLVFSVGYLMRTAVGRLFERSIDDLMNHLPGFRVIYNASKMAVETALSGTGELQKPVRLEVWNGLRMTAFKTGNRAPDGREILFLPTAPNITTGFVIEVEEDRYTEIEDDVEDALTRLLSAGFGEEDKTGAADLFGSDAGQQPGEVSVSELGDTDGAPDPTTDGGAADGAAPEGTTGEGSDEPPTTRSDG